MSRVARAVRALGPRAPRRDERGYIAVLTALLLTVFMGLAAFAVDVGHWYYVGQQEQRAADAAALAGVTSLPSDQASAYARARTFAQANGYSTASGDAVSASRIGATKLKVDISTDVDNFFGGLLGRPTTRVTRTAVAEYAGPVPMGSPCNRFGSDPDVSNHGSTNCNDTAAFWANVGSPAAKKSYGDAFQDNVCTTESGCSTGVNVDYDPDGYTYVVQVDKPTANLTIQAFDPAQIVVGDTCANNATNKLNAAAALAPGRAVITNPSTVYASGPGAYCTGDVGYNTGLVVTRFTIRSEGPDVWDPVSWPVVSGCDQTFQPFNGDLSKALDKHSPNFDPDVADTFRQWVTLCTFHGLTQPGRYAIQVKTNGLGGDSASGHNRFSLRAWGNNAGANDAISIYGSAKMAMYGNTPSGTTRFYLAKVPSGSGGHVLNVNLFDIGDGAVAGSTIQVIPPAEVGGSFTNCVGSGVVDGLLPTCTISVNSTYNGRWQSVGVPIPAGYSCSDASPTGCWVRLQFFYGTGSQPADTTSWTVSLEGDPIRLVQ